MKKVRFKKEYALPTNYRIAYELVSENLIIDADGKVCFNVKPFGLIPCFKMELTDSPTDVPYIDIAVALSNIK